MKHQTAENFETEQPPEALKNPSSDAKGDADVKDGKSKSKSKSDAKHKSKVAMRKKPVQRDDDPWALPPQTASILGLSEESSEQTTAKPIDRTSSKDGKSASHDGIKLSKETDAAVARFNEILEYSKSFSALAEEEVSSKDDEYEEVIYTAASLEGEPVAKRKPLFKPDPIEDIDVASVDDAGADITSATSADIDFSDLDDVISTKDIADVVMELEIGETAGRSPNFFEIRHGVRQLQFKYLGEVPYDNSIRTEFEGILEMLSAATVQFRTMQDKYGQFQAYREASDKEREKLQHITEAKKAAEEAVNEISRDLAFAQEENATIVVRCADMEREIKSVQEREKEALEQAEEARQQLVDHESTFKQDYEKAQLFEAENEVLRKSLSDACDTIVKGSSAQMMAEYRIQELEDKVAALVSIRTDH